MIFLNIWKGREKEAIIFHFLGGVGIGFLISAWFGTFLGLGIILVLTSLGGHYWAYQRSQRRQGEKI